jgi:hypothetical protein
VTCHCLMIRISRSDEPSPREDHRGRQTRLRTHVGYLSAEGVSGRDCGRRLRRSGPRALLGDQAPTVVIGPGDTLHQMALVAVNGQHAASSSLVFSGLGLIWVVCVGVCLFALQARSVRCACAWLSAGISLVDPRDPIDECGAGPLRDSGMPVARASAEIRSGVVPPDSLTPHPLTDVCADGSVHDPNQRLPSPR